MQQLAQSLWWSKDQTKGGLEPRKQGENGRCRDQKEVLLLSLLVRAMPANRIVQESFEYGSVRKRLGLRDQFLMHESIHYVFFRCFMAEHHHPSILLLAWPVGYTMIFKHTIPLFHCLDGIWVMLQPVSTTFQPLYCWPGTCVIPCSLNTTGYPSYCCIIPCSGEHCFPSILLFTWHLCYVMFFEHCCLSILLLALNLGYTIEPWHSLLNACLSVYPSTVGIAFRFCCGLSECAPDVGMVHKACDCVMFGRLCYSRNEGPNEITCDHEYLEEVVWS